MEEETRWSSVVRAGERVRESAAEGGRRVDGEGEATAFASAVMRARAAARDCSEGSLSMSVGGFVSMRSHEVGSDGDAGTREERTRKGLVVCWCH